jgi:hypothetical protein
MSDGARNYNLDSSEEEIISWLQEVPLMGKGAEIRQMDINYGLGLLQIKLQKSIANDQHNTSTSLIRATWALAFATIALVFATIALVFFD